MHIFLGRGRGKDVTSCGETSRIARTEWVIRQGAQNKLVSVGKQGFWLLEGLPLAQRCLEQHDPGSDHDCIVALLTAADVVPSLQTKCRRVAKALFVP